MMAERPDRMNVRGRKAHRVIIRYYFVAPDSQVLMNLRLLDGSAGGAQPVKAVKV